MADDDFERIKGNISLTAFCDSHGMEKRGRDTYVCPACHSGEGPRHTAAFKVFDDSRWTCFSCRRAGDVFDLAGILNGTEDKREQLATVCEWAGLETPQEAPIRTVISKMGNYTAASSIESKKDYTEARKHEEELIRESKSHLADQPAQDYLKGRGITEQDAQAWGLGYDPGRKRIVIPWVGARWYHVNRDITDQSDHKYEKPRSTEVGPQPLWNPEAFKSEAYFVVEGALDALAVSSCGYPSTALCGSGNNAYTAEMARHTGIPLIMLDADEHGEAGAKRIAADLDAKGVAYQLIDSSALGAKDAAEAYAKDRETLKSTLKRLYDEAIKTRQATKEKRYKEALKSAKVLSPVDVLGNLYLLANEQEPIPTGIHTLDTALGGGLPATGLVSLGALSSMGKTTLAVQLADTIATSGRPVLFVTIEQSAEEIVSKSVSRLVNSYSRTNGSQIEISSQDMRRSSERARWIKYDPEKQAAFVAACDRYTNEIAPHLEIMESTKQPTAKDVRTIAESLTEHDGQAPVIFIDYLQLLATPDERASDKQAADHNVMALRQLARDLKTCVFVISSLNRANYSSGVEMEAFKESGAIEYGSDVLLGLQPQGMTELAEGGGEAKQKRETRQLARKTRAGSKRDVELVILKNRNGGIPDHNIPLAYDAECNSFKAAHASSPALSVVL